jgi:glucosamine--fructose-6-phosphate aminotransferase (isomerizing)
VSSWFIRGYLIEKKARTTVVVKYASEFRYKVLIVTSKDVFIAISQPRETADLLTAIKLAKSIGIFIFGICKVVGFFIAREIHAGTYTYAGLKKEVFLKKHLQDKLQS